MTHAQLVARALHWVRVTMKFKLAAAEPPGTLECPDVIGFRHMGFTSMVVECKVSRRDFLKDLKKRNRHLEFSHIGMGTFRYYFAPSTRIIYPDDVPPRWGLAVLRGNRVRVLKKAKRFDAQSIESERTILYVMAQRATEGWGRKIFGDAAPPMVDGDPHPATFRIIKNQREEIKKLRETVEAMGRQNSELREIILENGITKGLP